VNVRTHHRLAVLVGLSATGAIVAGVATASLGASNPSVADDTPNYTLPFGPGVITHWQTSRATVNAAGTVSADLQDTERSDALVPFAVDWSTLRYVASSSTVHVFLASARSDAAGRANPSVCVFGIGIGGDGVHGVNWLCGPTLTVGTGKVQLRAALPNGKTTLVGLEPDSVTSIRDGAKVLPVTNNVYIEDDVPVTDADLVVTAITEGGAAVPLNLSRP
jgi:hypothetical protein